MNNAAQTIGILLLLSVTAVAQTSGIDDLLDNIHSMNQTVYEMREANDKRLEDLKGYQEYAYQKWAKTTAFGIGGLILAMNMFWLLEERIRRKRHIKTRQEYIIDLEKQLESQYKGIIETLRHNNQLTNDFTTQAKMFTLQAGKIEEIIKNLDKTPNPTRDKMLLASGILIGLGVMMIANMLMGVL